MPSEETGDGIVFIFEHWRINTPYFALSRKKKKGTGYFIGL
jgi:hypothetical protein